VAKSTKKKVRRSVTVPSRTSGDVQQYDDHDHRHGRRDAGLGVGGTVGFKGRGRARRFAAGRAPRRPRVAAKKFGVKESRSASGPRLRTRVRDHFAPGGRAADSVHRGRDSAPAQRVAGPRRSAGVKHRRRDEAETWAGRS